jgi:hypothetical protein
MGSGPREAVYSRGRRCLWQSPAFRGLEEEAEQEWLKEEEQKEEELGMQKRKKPEMMSPPF